MLPGMLQFGVNVPLGYLLEYFWQPGKPPLAVLPIEVLLAGRFLPG